MQVTIDVDKNFIENLKEEFHTPHIKDALYQLLDFYKKSHAIEEIEISDSDHRFIDTARIRRKNGEKTYNIDDIISDYE